MSQRTETHQSRDICSQLRGESHRLDRRKGEKRRTGMEDETGDEEEDGSRDEEKSRGTWTGAGLWALGLGGGGHALHTSHRHVVGAANTLVPTAFSWAAVRCGGWIGGPPHQTGGQGTRWSPCLELQTPGRTRVPHLLRQVDVSNGTCTLGMSKLLGQHVPWLQSPPLLSNASPISRLKSGVSDKGHNVFRDVYRVLLPRERDQSMYKTES